MVSWWPFKGDDTSAAGFEKVLAKLSDQINRASAQNDSFRQKQRRYKVLWTLYSTFAYILVAAILTLVTGYQRWGAVEYSAVAGGPVVIYAIRTALDAYYNYRVSNAQAHLNDLYKQREKAIAKLKAATKYDSTQQLLDKYGGSPRKRQPSPKPQGKRKSEGGLSNQGTPQPPVQRTGFAPPPTANIQRPMTSPISPQGTPDAARRVSQGFPPPQASAQPPQEGPGEEFAPNAFARPPPPALNYPAATQYSEGPKWYDRILDVVLGEDETQAKNRIALICQECRLVNGQAPPGARTLEDVGKWRCSSCNAWNGVESEEKKILKQMSGVPQSPASPMEMPQSAVSEATTGSEGGESGEYEHVDEEDVHEGDGMEQDEGQVAEELSPAGSTRSKARQRRKA
jgi:endoplasmic reticulum junction formation protein lunapark